MVIHSSEGSSARKRLVVNVNCQLHRTLQHQDRADLHNQAICGSSVLSVGGGVAAAAGGASAQFNDSVDGFGGAVAGSACVKADHTHAERQQPGANPPSRRADRTDHNGQATQGSNRERETFMRALKFLGQKSTHHQGPRALPAPDRHPATSPQKSHEKAY